MKQQIIILYLSYKYTYKSNLYRYNKYLTKNVHLIHFSHVSPGDHFMKWLTFHNTDNILLSMYHIIILCYIQYYIT